MENKGRKYVLLILNIIIGIIIISPILYGFSISLMSSDEIFSYPPKLLPSGINLDNYRQVIENGTNFGLYI